MEKNWAGKVIFSDKKWFCLKPHPNRKKEASWSVNNLNEVEEVRDEAVAEVTAWVGMDRGRLLSIH